MHASLHLLYMSRQRSSRVSFTSFRLTLHRVAFRLEVLSVRTQSWGLARRVRKHYAIRCRNQPKVVYLRRFLGNTMTTQQHNTTQHNTTTQQHNAARSQMAAPSCSRDLVLELEPLPRRNVHGDERCSQTQAAEPLNQPRRQPMRRTLEGETKCIVVWTRFACTERERRGQNQKGRQRLHRDGSARHQFQAVSQKTVRVDLHTRARNKHPLHARTRIHMRTLALTLMTRSVAP